MISLERVFYLYFGEITQEMCCVQNIYQYLHGELIQMEKMIQINALLKERGCPPKKKI